MSAFFASASSQRLLNTASPITAYSLSVGLWVRPTTTGTTRTIWQTSQTTGVTFFNIQQSSSNAFSAGVSGGSATAGTVVANTWFYIVARFINATNRQISVLSSDGIVSTGSNATSDTPAATVNMAFGASSATSAVTFFDGSIGEWWITNTDIQPDGAALQASTLWQLARCGPFSIPNVASAVVDYHSFRYALSSEQDKQPDYFSGNKGRPTWVNTNAVTLAAHPPFLAPEYKRPGDFVRPGIV